MYQPDVDQEFKLAANTLNTQTQILAGIKRRFLQKLFTKFEGDELQWENLQILKAKYFEQNKLEYLTPLDTETEETEKTSTKAGKPEGGSATHGVGNLSAARYAKGKTAVEQKVAATTSISGQTPLKSKRLAVNIPPYADPILALSRATIGTDHPDESRVEGASALGRQSNDTNYKTATADVTNRIEVKYNDLDWSESSGKSLNDQKKNLLMKLEMELISIDFKLNLWNTRQKHSVLYWYKRDLFKHKLSKVENLLYTCDLEFAK